MEKPLFVPTNRHGTQRDAEVEVHWPLPPDDGGQGPGSDLAADSGSSLSLLDAGALLDNLAERIFVAEVVTPAAEPSGREGVVASERARLVRETAWSPRAAASFALDCADHVLSDAGSITLPSGASLEAIITAARAALEGDAEHGGVFHRFSRIAAGRRLRRSSEEVGDEAFALTIEHEAEDSEALDDPDFGVLASVREAVLTAVEAVQHGAVPHLVEADSSLYNMYPSSNRVPVHLSAKSCADRAREAAAGAGRSESEEREWQAQELLKALGEG